MRHRDDLEEVQKQLRDVEGATAIVYVQMCATKKRSMQSGCARVTQIEVKLDPQSRRPLEIYSFLGDGENRVLHGQRITYNWMVGDALYETYRNGAKDESKSFSRMWNP